MSEAEVRSKEMIISASQTEVLRSEMIISASQTEFQRSEIIISAPRTEVLRPEMIISAFEMIISLADTMIKISCLHNLCRINHLTVAFDHGLCD
jgi:hypothetical protein